MTIIKRKYEFIEDDTVTTADGRTLKRIRSLVFIGSAVRPGQLGGYIEGDANLSHDDRAWVFDNAWVYGNARVFDNARVRGSARVFEDAQIYGSARVLGDARVSGSAHVSGIARVRLEAHGDMLLTARDAEFQREAPARAAPALQRESPPRVARRIEPAPPPDVERDRINEDLRNRATIRSDDLPQRLHNLGGDEFRPTLAELVYLLTADLGDRTNWHGWAQMTVDPQGAYMFYLAICRGTSDNPHWLGVPLNRGVAREAGRYLDER